MLTVSQAVDYIAGLTNQQRGRVNQFARALIDAGILPKSTGRDIKKMSAEQLLPLLAAVGMADKVSDVARVGREFAALPLQSQNNADAATDLAHFFAMKMDPRLPWMKCDLEFAKTPNGSFYASFVFPGSRQVTFFTIAEWGGYCKSSFTISSSGLENLRYILSRDDAQLERIFPLDLSVRWQ